jgi:hypothetical protein
MKNLVMGVLLALLWNTFVIAAELKVGEQAIDFSLKDSLGREYTLNSPELKGDRKSVV